MAEPQLHSSPRLSESGRGRYRKGDRQREKETGRDRQTDIYKRQVNRLNRRRVGVKIVKDHDMPTLVLYDSPACAQVCMIDGCVLR